MTALPDVTAQPFSEAEAEALFGAILDAQVSDEAIAGFLVALSDRGETASEIAGAARAMRARMIPVRAPDNAIDVCGTGGDGQHSLNVSTAVAIVVAACGVPVAKHGNRAASSKAGAADTLEALGLNLAKAGELAETTLDEIGIAFLFAQTHHPKLKHIAPIRRTLGRRTIFNLLGPLANPAHVSRQLIGLARADLLPSYSKAMNILGYERAMIVAGSEKGNPNAGWIDEISISGKNKFKGIRLPKKADGLNLYNAFRHFSPMSALRGSDAQHNADALRRLLMGELSPYRDAVIVNSAGALIVAGEVEDWRSGMEEAAEAIDKGLAKGLLDCWIKACS